MWREGFGSPEKLWRSAPYDRARPLAGFIPAASREEWEKGREGRGTEREKRGRKEEKWKESWNRAADWLRPALMARLVSERVELLRLKKLCELFSIDFKTAQNGFRDFIDDGGSRMSEELVELKGAVETIPVTSADAERGFSTMNVICSSL